MPLTDSSPVRPAASDSPIRTLAASIGVSYFAIALIARLPYAMIVVGVLTMVVDARGSLAVGGLTSAMVGLGTIATGPLIGAAADRWGQRPVLLLAALVQSAVLVALVAVAYGDTPEGLLLLVSALAGATAPQVSPMSRARLVGAIGRMRLAAGARGRLQESTMGYESAVDEIVFVFGPVLVGVVAIAATPAAPVLAAAALTLAFVTAFALHPTARTAGHAAGSAEREPARSIARPGILLAAGGTFATGLFFGSMLTSLTAFADEGGFPEQTGILYGIMGIGSAILALAVGMLPRRFSLPWRWIAFTGILVIGAVLAAGATGALSMGWALALAGCGIGPTLATLYALAAARSPRGREATVMAILGSSVVVGQALSSMVVGSMAESAGSTIALWAPVAAAALLMIFGLANLRARQSVHR
ncbi:MFS transporter [Microbacterium oleivorans]|uniref:Putatie arabinose efflux permease n=1 Tax=Microbacterium oleivorans TaxID=273677 RepID=A0A031FRM7_9MICO|nr:MFS transporter [Microbacterium oleivorans]EZP26260.1 Putatie arabinose efflux permease [Microbacterium oleivorans]